MPGPLHGISVLEVSQIIAGPMCGVFLSDMGADVVKVESPAGDGVRLVGQFAPHESKAFHVFNRGKRGIVLNLADEDGRAVAHRLVRDFDVFLINARPGVPARLGLDYETLRAERPDLIYLDNTAYGPEGPSAHRAGADIIAQAYSGLMAGDEKFNEDDGPQLITATTPADFSAAYSSAIGVCAALYHRERTGEGQRIQTSLLASALTLENAFVSRLPVSDAVLLDPTLEAIEAARARGASWRELQTARGGTRTLVGGAFLLYYGGYQTSDGAVMLGCVTPANQQQVRDAIELGHDPTTDADFNPLDPAAVEVVAGVRRRIAERFLSNTTDHWIERLDATGAPASQVNLPEDMVDDPQVEALGIMVELEHSLTGPETMVGPSWSMSATPLEAQGAAPGLDEDTDAVLAEHGYSAEQIAALRASGAVGLRPGG